MNLIGFVSISAFTYFTNLLYCLITAGIKKYKSIIKKKRKKHDQIVLLGKSKLSSTEVLISKDLIDSTISHDEFVLIDNVLNKFFDMKEAIKNSNNKLKFKLLVKQCCFIV